MWLPVYIYQSPLIPVSLIFSFASVISLRKEKTPPSCAAFRRISGVFVCFISSVSPLVLVSFSSFSFVMLFFIVLYCRYLYGICFEMLAFGCCRVLLFNAYSCVDRFVRIFLVRVLWSKGFGILGFWFLVMFLLDCSWMRMYRYVCNCEGLSFDLDFWFEMVIKLFVPVGFFGGLNWTRVRQVCPGWVALGYGCFRCFCRWCI